VTCPPRRKLEENRQREEKQTLCAPHKGKRNSVTIIRCRGSAGGIVISVGIGIGITVTANCAGPEFGGCHVECVDRCRVVPLGACETSLFDNILRLDTMVIEVGAKVGSGTPVLGTMTRVLVVRIGPMDTLTQVLDVGLGGQGTWRCAVATWSVWATLAVRDAPELTCTCLLHESKRELLVVVKVVQDVVIRISKGSLDRGLESGHEDRLQDIVKGEVVEVAQSFASFIDFSKVDIDSVL
jgi:hypothetical protein